jgi:hypothetical protein
MEKLLILTFYLVIVFSISYFIGKKKKVGFWWSVFFCSFLTPIIGLIIVLRSDSKDYIEVNKSKGSILGGFLLVLGILCLLGQLNYLNKDQSMFFDSRAFWISIGIIGGGIYLSKSKK